ncbi:MAG: menaquinone biosynthesis protein [Ferruginibacter sp.]
MERKIRVAAVDYLNTKPLIYGLDEMKDSIELLLDYPSNIGKLLRDDVIDIGLVPVAVIPSLKEHHIITDYCIGCDGEVNSVCLFCDVPLSQIEKIYLDYQSETSVKLFTILLKKHWKISPVILNGFPGYEKEITGTTAGLVIGDRALLLRKKYKYIFDLGSAWKEMTGLPFVFATWVSNKILPPEFVRSFNAAVGTGLSHIAEIAFLHSQFDVDLIEYYTRNIDYILDERKKEGLQLFISILTEIDTVQ